MAGCPGSAPGQIPATHQARHRTAPTEPGHEPRLPTRGRENRQGETLANDGRKQRNPASDGIAEPARRHCSR